MLNRRSLLRAGAAGIAGAAGLLAACSNDEEEPVSTAANPAPASSTRPPVTAAPPGPDAELVGQFRLPEKGAPGGLDWNPAGDRLAVTGPGQVALFATGAGAGGAAVVAAKAHGTSMANSVTWAPDGGRFATVGTDSLLQFWTADGAPTRSVQVKGVERHGLVRWSPAGNLLVLSTGNTPMVVDVSRAEPGQPVAGPKVEVLYEIAWAPDGASYYAVGAGGVTRNPVTPGAPLAVLADPAVRVWRSAAVAPDGRVVVAARKDDEDLISVYSPELSAPGPRFELPQGTSTVTTMRFAPDGRRLVIGFQHGPVGVWEVTGTRARYLGGYKGHPRAGDGGYGVAGQPRTDRVASLDADGSVHLWRLTSG